MIDYSLQIFYYFNLSSVRWIVYRMWSVNSGAGNAPSPLLTWQRHKSAHRNGFLLITEFRVPPPPPPPPCTFWGMRPPPSPETRCVRAVRGAVRGAGAAPARSLRCAGAALGGSRFSWDGRRRVPVPLPTLSPSPSRCPAPLLPFFQERESLAKRWGAEMPGAASPGWWQPETSSGFCL